MDIDSLFNFAGMCVSEAYLETPNTIYVGFVLIPYRGRETPTSKSASSF